MDNPVILKKIESLMYCVRRIEDKRPPSAAVLREDADLQDIISVNLERAIQLCVDICAIIISRSGLQTPNTMAGMFASLQKAGLLSEELSKKMQKAVGFRNISVHEYEALDWDLVFDVITHHLGNFRRFVEEIDTLDSAP